MNSTEFFEQLKSISFGDISHLFFSSNYFSFYFIVYCFYICYYLRIGAPIGGLHPARSAILGFILAYSPRFVYGKIVHSVLPEMEDNSVYRKYSIVWILMNLCPFDVVFTIIRTPVFRTSLQLLSTFGNTMQLNSTIYSMLSVFPNENLKVFVCCVFAFSVPVFIDYLDSQIFGNKRCFELKRRPHYLMFLPFHWIKRVSLFVLIELGFSQPHWLLPDKYTRPLFSINIPVACFATICSVVDLISHDGNPFFMVDFIFRKMFDNFFTYYPLKPIQGVHEHAIHYKVE